MELFFTSDQHYGHARILDYCKRPFADIEQMNETLIERHNAVVGKKDKVFHVGDFAFRNHGDYLKRLNGQHVLILGNHDRLSEVGTGWQAVEQVMRLKAAGTVIWLAHYAHLVWPQSHYGAWHLFGHTHGSMKGVGRSMDVGVDTNEFTPWHIDQVAEVMERLPVITRSERANL